MSKLKREQFIAQRAIPVGMPSIDVGGKKVNVGTAMDEATTANAANGIGPSIFSIGNQLIEPNLFAWYTNHGFIGYQACSIISQQWLVNKACSIKGRDAVAKWFKITANDGQEIKPEVIKYLEKRNRQLKLKHHLCNASKFNNVFGIRHVLFVFDNVSDDFYENPFNPDAIKKGSYKGMSQVDPYWVASNLSEEAVSDPINQHFYEPTHWTIGSRKIHRSHFVILRGDEVSDFLKPSYQYGGLSLTQQIYERVYASERTANEAPMLAMTKRLNIYKLNDLEKAIAKPEILEDANEFLAEQRDNYGVLYTGKDEEIQQLETSLTDLDATIMTQYQLVAAIARVPATKLLGTSPKGFSSTGEHEIETYHEELESVQENEMDPIVERHMICLMRSDIKPKFGVDFEVDITWNPQKMESRKEKAEIESLNSTIAKNYSEIGAVDGLDVRNKIASDENSDYNGIETFERSDVEEEEETEEVSNAKES